LIDRPAINGVAKKGMLRVEPVLAGEVAFRAWTNGGKLRHASVKTGATTRLSGFEIHERE